MIKSKDSLSIGVIRLDEDYPAIIGDIDHPFSFNNNVYYKKVPGLTFNICKSGKIPNKVLYEFLNVLEYFCKNEDINFVIGNCGFMIVFQEIAVRFTKKPVLLSPLLQLKSIVSLYKDFEIIIITSNSLSLNLLHTQLAKQCNYCNIDNIRILGCENIDGFEAITKREKINFEKCKNNIISKIKDVLIYSRTKCFLLECTQLCSFANNIRNEFRIPVYDAFTNINFVLSSLKHT